MEPHTSTHLGSIIWEGLKCWPRSVRACVGTIPQNVYGGATRRAGRTDPGLFRQRLIRLLCTTMRVAEFGKFMANPGAMFTFFGLKPAGTCSGRQRTPRSDRVATASTCLGKPNLSPPITTTAQLLHGP